MASGVVNKVTDINALSKAEGIKGSDWLNVGLKAGMSIGMFALQEKNRNMMRKNINQNIANLNDNIKKSKNSLQKEQASMATTVKANITAALRKHESDMKKMQTMLAILDSFDKPPINVEHIATSIGIALVIFVFGYVGYVIIKKHKK
jgi:septal ring factor EnvC (AmiA/AmiB activator)